MTDAAALAVSGLSHDWGGKPALRDVSLRVETGRFCALLGPNGAGKSTLISVLTGLIRPRPGVVSIAGHDMARARRATLAHIGVVFQQPTLDLDRSVRANLRYFAALHGLTRRAADLRIEESLTQLGMAERVDESVRALNGGHRRRMEIARALIHGPRLLVLDEPTVGLDAPARAAITRHVHALTEGGISVLWATHLADELAPDDDVVVLRKGAVVAQGTLADLSQDRPVIDWFSAVMEEAP